MQANDTDANQAAIDLGPLAWVLDELRKSLDAASAALRRFVRDTAAARGIDQDAVDDAPLRLARQQLHQAVGALEMVGLPVPAQVLRAMEAAVQKFSEKPQLCTEAAAARIERAGFSLTQYLGGLLLGKPASSIALFPQYRETQELAGSDRIHPADLWSFDFRWNEPKLPQAAPAQAYGPAVRARMDNAVLRLVRSADAPAGREMAQLCLGLAAGQSQAQPRIFWKISAGYFEALGLGLLPPDIYVKRAASRVLMQYASLAKGDNAISDRLAQDLLFFCAQAGPAPAAEAPVLVAVRRAWGLAAATPVDYQTPQFGRFDPVLLAQARKRIAAAKEAWSAAAGGDLNKLRGVVDQFHLVGESMQKLHPHSTPLARALNAAVEAVARAGKAPGPEMGLEVATAVLYLEAGFDEFGPADAQIEARTSRLAERLDQVRQGGKSQPLEPWIEELYGRVSDRQTMGSVVGELRTTLGELEKLLDQFFRNALDKTPLQAAPGHLSQMRGVLSVLGLEQAAQAVLRMREAVEGIIETEVDEAQARAAGTFDKLGNNLGALGFLIDMLNYQPALAKKLFVYDDVLGELKPLMGRGAAAGATASDLPVVADATLAADALAVLTDAQDGGEADALSARLDTLAMQAILADQTALAQTAREASAAVSGADAGAASAALNTLAEAMHAAGPVAPPALPAQDDFEEDDLQGIFLEEAREVVQTGLAALEVLAHQPGDLSELTTLRRAFHTLKGSSRMVGLNEFGDAGWSMEQVLNTWLADQKSANDDLRHLCGDALRAFGRWVEDIATGQAGAWRASVFRDPADALRTEHRLLPLLVPGAVTAAVATAADVEAPELAPAEFTGLDAAGGSGTLSPDTPAEADPLSGFVDAPAVPVAQISNGFQLPEGAQVLEEVSAPEDAQMLAELAAALAAPAAGMAAPDGDPAAAGQDRALAQVGEESDALPFSDLAGFAQTPSVEATQAVDILDGAEAAEAFAAFEALEAAQAAEAAEAAEAFYALDVQAAESVAGEPSETIDILDAVAELGPPAEPVSEAAPLASEWQAMAPATLAVTPDAFDALDAVNAVNAGDAVDVGDAVDAVDVTDAVDASAEAFAHPLALAETAPAPLENTAPGAGDTQEEHPLYGDAEPHDDQIKVIGSLRIGLPLYNVYLNEADEWSRRLVTEVNEWSLELNQRLPDSTVGLAHALGGSSATVGFHALSAIARALEDALSHAQDLACGTPQHGQTFGDAAEEIRRLLHQFAAGFLKEPDPRILPALQALGQLHGWQRGEPPEAEGIENTAAFESFEPVAFDPMHAGEQVSEPSPEPLQLTQAEPEPVPQARLADVPVATRRFSADAPGALIPSPEDLDELDAVDAVDMDLFPIFEEEAAELLPQLGGALRQWVARPDNRSARDEVLRALHTLKGSARLAGALRLGELAHRLESEIEHLGSGVANASDLEPLLNRFDGMQANFEWLRSGAGKAPAPDLEALAEAEAAAVVQAAAELAQHSPAADATTTPSGALPSDAAPRALARPAVMLVAPQRAAANHAVRVRSQLLDRLVNQTGEVMITRSRLEAELGQLRVSLADLTGNLDRLRSQLRDIELQAESQMQSRLAQAKDSAAGFDPLEFDRFTRVQELTRMMAESVNDVATVQRNLQRTVQATEDDLIAQGRQTRELQRDLLRTRMVEFESIADRLYRVVRMASKETGKQVRLDISGGSIEMDRGVLDRMTPAFEHLLRNCVVHGIEEPERRLGAGKESAGTIAIVLSHEGNDVSVEFRDDGAGLDLARIREKAREQGLVQPGQSLSDADAGNLIFMPGFSTAAQVTELAGRGIGMDVVRSEVNALGGRIETGTESGQGTRFKLVLPLTTAVTQVVMIRSGSLSIGVPANLVEIVIRAPQAAVQQAYASGFYEVGGEQVPFYWSGALLQASQRSAEAPAKTMTLVVFRSAAQRIVVHVDQVLGNQEAVVKNLGPQLARLPGLAGMSVLASGAVVLIYNPVALTVVYGEQARLLGAEQARFGPVAQGPGERAALAAAVPQTPLVLVVDDSITVRRVTQRLLQREGYRVAMAADGLQALARLAEERPTLVLSDIEMPRMDGFDLARNIRADAKLAGLPIIMITSRIAAKHREHAMALGVNHYLGKPYSEEELLSLIRHHCKAAALA